jgi:hypothetical protein
MPRMSSQSFSRAAKALCTTRSSAEHVVTVAPSPMSKGLLRSMVRSSKGIAPSETSTGVALLAMSSKVRCRSAKSRASESRPRNERRRASTKRSSPPNPVMSVRSTSAVMRGLPHRWTASPPMKQTRTPRRGRWSRPRAPVGAVVHREGRRTRFRATRRSPLGSMGTRSVTRQTAAAVLLFEGVSCRVDPSTSCPRSSSSRDSPDSPARRHGRRGARSLP